MEIPNIALVSRTEEANAYVERKLEALRSEFGVLRTTKMAQESVLTGVNASTSLVIYNVNEWTRTEAQTVVEMRITGFTGPVLVLSSSVPSDGFRGLRVMTNVSFLEKPLNEIEFTGVTRRMLTGTSSPRGFRRFATDCPAEVEVMGRVVKHHSRLTNISKGGAFVEFASPAPVKVGDILNMRVELDEKNRTYVMRSRVTRIVPKTSRGGIGAGVQFLDLWRPLAG